MAFELARRLGRGTLAQSGTHGMVLLLAIIMHGTAVWQGIYTPAGVGTQVADGKETREFDGKTYLLEHGIVGTLAQGPEAVDGDL